ncbi:translocation/assembly module TamB domain-containing protein [Chlorobaculum limnaeum]|nr:translocation/assembly module TamB domain-containing protein [Chlorobaculum limnaeum]
MTAASAIIIMLVIAAALVLNSGMIDLFAKKQLLSLFNNEYQGRLELKEVKLRFPDQVTLVNPGIFEEKAAQPAARADSITLKFNFLSLLRPKITLLSFKEVDVDGPQVNIAEYPDGKFNIEKIFTRKRPDDPEVLAIEKFRARRLKVRNGSLSWKPDNAPAYRLQNLRIDMSKAFVAKYEFMGTIKQMQFTMPDRGLTLKKGSGSLAFSSVRSDVLGLDLETAKSHAKLSISVDGLDIFSGITKKKLLKNRTFIHVESLSLDTSELNRFISIPALPAGVYQLKGDAKGTFANLEILPVSIEHGDSRIAFKGEMLNPLDPESLSFNLQIDKSTLSPALLTKVLDDERYRKLAREAKGISFTGMLRGRLDEWMTGIDFKTAIGSGSTEFETKRLAGGKYEVDGAFTLEKTEPHRLLDLGEVKSGFSGLGSFSGSLGASGIETAHFEASVKNAFWQQQTISSGSVTLDLKGKKLDLSTDLKSPDGGSLVMAGLIDFSTLAPSYEAGGTVRKLDLSKATGLQDFRSDLNGRFDVKGQGLDLASLNLKASMVLEPSSFSDFRFRERSAVSASVVQSAGSSSVSLESEAFDFSVQGNASMARMIETIQMASACIARETGNAAAVPLPQGQSPWTFTYRLTVRDLAPLRPLLPAKELQFRGTASGKAAWEGGRLLLDTDISSPSLSNSPSLRMDNAAMTGSIQCASAGVETARLSGTAGSMSLFGRELRSLRLNASFDNDRLDASFDVAMPQFTEKLSAAFTARRVGNVAAVSIDRLALTTPKGIWQSAPGGTLEVAKDFLRFNRVRFEKGAQSLQLDGLLSNEVSGTFRGTLANIDLAEANYFLLDPALKAMSGAVNASFTVSGTPGAKTGDLDLRGSGVTYDELNIGAIHLTARHSGDQLRFEYESRGAAAQNGSRALLPVNTIRGSGTIPLVLNYSPVEIRIPENRPLRIALNSDDLSARIITWIVPIFDRAEGVIPTGLRITGTMPKPDIFLTTLLRDTRIRVGPTQVTYRVNGEITGTPSRIDLGRIELRDSQENSGTISGMIGLDGLKPVTVNLAASFRDLLLYSKKDMKDDTSFGTISGTTNNLRFYGDMTAPVAEGNLMLTSANFSLYRKGSSESAKYIGVEKYITFVPRRPAPKPVETAAAPVSAQFHYNLLDILQIRNLRLSFSAPIKGAMIFDRIRGERIEATLSNLSLLVNKAGQRFSLLGSVDITGGKYTFSNTSFDLENSGRVSWNNDEIREGRLIDIYGGKQVTATDVQTGERDNVKLLIAVSGTIEKPNVRMGYYLNDDPQPWSAVNMIGRQSSHIDPNADLNVISMLFSRQWYLHPEGQASRGVSPVSSVGISAGTGLLSSQVSNIVQNLAGLESFNLNLGTGAKGNLSGLELSYAMLVPGTSGKIRFVGTNTTPIAGSSNTTNYYNGSSQKIEYRVSPKVYVEAFRSYGMAGNDAAYINLQKPSENWGVSVSYREKFHTWSQFWNNLFGGKKKEKEKDKKE